MFRVDSPQLLRDHVRAGDVLPLNRGAGGRVLMAFSISAPVWNSAGELVGALTLTAPEQRVLPSFTDELRKSAAKLTVALGGVAPKPGR